MQTVQGGGLKIRSTHRENTSAFDTLAHNGKQCLCKLARRKTTNERPRKLRSVQDGVRAVDVHGCEKFFSFPQSSNIKLGIHSTKAI